ncbi:MAG TPA: UrcA family protein [Allosphingosinicella sp.]|nr:UrcA family protein [Allosphingosinicella sp.]
MTKTFCTLAFLSLLAAAPAAAEPADTVTAVVEQDDLNLATAAGRATLKGRVKAAADRVCGAVPVAPLREAGPVAACRAALFRSAEARIGLAFGSETAEVRGTH